MAELSNDNLSLWLKARDGLPCEEARALIERIGESEEEADEEYHLREEAEEKAAREKEEFLRSQRQSIEKAIFEADKVQAQFADLAKHLRNMLVALD